MQDEEDFTTCVCDDSERALRAYMDNYADTPMTQEQREWCIEEADHCGEGSNPREEGEKLNDRDLAKWTYWAMVAYVQSNCL